MHSWAARLGADSIFWVASNIADDRSFWHSSRPDDLSLGWARLEGRRRSHLSFGIATRSSASPSQVPYQKLDTLVKLWSSGKCFRGKSGPMKTFVEYPHFFSSGDTPVELSAYLCRPRIVSLHRGA